MTIIVIINKDTGYDVNYFDKFSDLDAFLKSKSLSEIDNMKFFKGDEIVINPSFDFVTKKGKGKGELQ
jgi:hypothetical protein